jgi:hypothetical protein
VLDPLEGTHRNLGALYRVLVKSLRSSKGCPKLVLAIVAKRRVPRASLHIIPMAHSPQPQLLLTRLPTPAQVLALMRL